MEHTRYKKQASHIPLLNAAAVLWHDNELLCALSCVKFHMHRLKINVCLCCAHREEKDMEKVRGKEGFSRSDVILEST